jgi:tetratricopeptide (TPR) repeat protein
MTAKSTTFDKQIFIGIDFGTTKTMVAIYDETKKSARPITIGRGKFEMPTSMYATEMGVLLFGDDADDEGITDMPNHIRRFKMKLGKSTMAHVGRKSGTALQLTTEYLRNLRKQLENQAIHASVDRAILTVPAMFGPAQRNDLSQAARQAGFTHVELLEEPVAAGIAYCDHQGDLSKQLRFIVVDWGGGTFDVAHVERSASGEIKVHEDFVVGLDDIGGEVFDDELWGIASKALDSAGHGRLDSQSRASWGRYIRDLSRAKEILSSQASVSMTFILDEGKQAKVTLDRADFNNIISPMVHKAASFVIQLIVRAYNAGCPPEFILLAGGTSRIPFIAEEFEKITGVKCRQWSEGREAIALGAAIRSNQLWGKVLFNEESKSTTSSKNNLTKEEYETLEKVKTLVLDGRYDEAFKIITEMLILQPSDEVFFLWNEVAIAVPDGEAVLAQAREIYSQRGNDFWGAACLAASLAGLGRFKESSNILSKTSTNDTVASHFLRTLNPDDADHKINCNAAYIKHPTHPWFLTEQSSALYDKGEIIAGEHMARRAVEKAPFSISCRFGLVSFLLRSEEATDVYDHVRIMERISSRTLFSIFARLFWLIKNDPSHSQIRELLEKALADQRVNSGGKSLLATCYMIRAKLRNPENEQQLILEDLNHAISICPNDIDSRIARGEYFDSADRPHEAIKDFDIALKEDPENFDARLAKADCLMWKIDHLAAAGEYKKAFSQNPTNDAAKSGMIISILYKYFSLVVNGSASSYLAPNIPDEKRTNAISSYGNSVILEDLVFFLWDNTFWGSARKGLMIGLNGIVYSDEKSKIAIEFKFMAIERHASAIKIFDQRFPSSKYIFITASDINSNNIMRFLPITLNEIINCVSLQITNKKWHYQTDGGSIATIEEELLKELSESGTLKGNAFVWCKGMPDWKPAIDVFPWIFK